MRTNRVHAVPRCDGFRFVAYAQALMRPARCRETAAQGRPSVHAHRAAAKRSTPSLVTESSAKGRTSARASFAPKQRRTLFVPLVWGGASVKNGRSRGAKIGPEIFEVTDVKSERRAVLIEYSRSRRIGGSPSVGRNRGNRVSRAARLNASQTAARAVTTSGQLSLGSPLSADGAPSSRPLCQRSSAGAWARSGFRRATWRT